jgi:hypothetical protein
MRVTLTRKEGTPVNNESSRLKLLAKRSKLFREKKSCLNRRRTELKVGAVFCGTAIPGGHEH